MLVFYTKIPPIYCYIGLFIAFPLANTLRYLFFLPVLFITVHLCGQGQGNNWYFGQNAGISFNTSPPTTFTGALVTQEGCSSISDPSGNLLFYTDGLTVWDKTHAVMANGSGLMGNASTAQSAVIVKQPGNTNIYYVFTMGVSNVGSLNYSVVDMALAAGNGSVIVKNTYLHGPCLEKLTAVNHSNNQDVWVLVHENGTSTNFRAYLLTSNGVSTTAVISNVGANGTTQSIGYLRASPNGLHIASGFYTGTGGVELYDFNRTTGVLSNPILLPVGGLTYGVEFSPDGTKLYASGGSNFIKQWSICAGSATAIAATEYTFAGSFNWAMQLGPDGKIYVSRHNNGFLGVINNPNVAGVGCNYNSTGLPLASPGLCRLGLPNYVTSWFLPPPPQFTVTIGTASNGIGCMTASFTSPPTLSLTLPGCSALTSSLSSMIWHFGDPGSGSANTSTLPHPVHMFSNLGTYTVSLILSYSNNGGNDTLKQIVNITDPCITVTSSSITCASLGSATVNALGGLGPFSYTWMPSVQTGSVATGLSPGAYTITVYDLGNNFTYTAQTIFTSLVPLSGNVAYSPSLSCPGANTGTASVTGLTGGSGSQSYLWSNGITSYSGSTTNSLSAGIWSLNVTDALTGCKIDQTLFISQPSPFQLNVSANSPTACAGGSVILTGTNSGGTPGYTYSWTGAAAANSTNVSELTAGSHVYTLVSTDANNCTVSNTIGVNFIPNPTITVSSMSICPFATGTLIANGAASYTWASPNIPNQPVGQSFTDAPLSNTEYTVIGTAFGCTSAATGSIIMLPVPVPTITSNSPVCENTNLVLNVYGASSYNWSGPQGFVSAASLNTLNAVAVNKTGVYNATVTSAAGCTAAINTTVIVNPTPTVSANGATVCTSQTLNLSSLSVSGAGFSWNGPLGFQSTQQSPSIIAPSVGHSGLFYIKVTSAEGCTNIATATVSVLAPPSLTIAVSTASLCWQNFNGSRNTITVTAFGAKTYSLYTPGLFSASGITNGQATIFTAPPYSNNPTVATGTLEGSNGVCSSMSTFNFTVIPNPTVTLNSFAPGICAGESFTYTSLGASSYTWSSSSPNFKTYNSGAIVVVNPISNAVLSVYGSSLGCRSATESTSITVFPLPVFSLSPSFTSICLYERTVLTASGTGTSYQWSPSTGLNNSVGATVSASPPANQQYTVIASANNCTSSAVVSVSVHPLPVAVITAPQEVCLGNTITLSGSGGAGYEWRGPGNFYSDKKTVDLKAIGIHFDGNYSLTVTDDRGCKNTSSSYVDVLPLPEANLTGVQEKGCVPFCSTYSVIAATSIVSSWTINDVGYYDKHFSACFNSPGTYTISGKLSDSQTACENTLSYQVRVYPKPMADFGYSPAMPIENADEVSFTNRSEGENQTEWKWFFDDKNGYTAQTENTSFLYPDAGFYTVAMIVTNEFQCSDTVVKSLEVMADFGLYVPNVFTPDGDGLNDVFLPVVRSIRLYDLQVFDRWGQEVFHSKSPAHGWDGTFRSELCKQDVYVWKIKLSTKSGESKEHAGSVTLLSSE